MIFSRDKNRWTYNFGLESGSKFVLPQSTLERIEDRNGSLCTTWHKFKRKRRSKTSVYLLSGTENEIVNKQANPDVQGKELKQKTFSLQLFTGSRTRDLSSEGFTPPLPSFDFRIVATVIQDCLAIYSWRLQCRSSQMKEKKELYNRLREAQKITWGKKQEINQ